MTDKHQPESPTPTLALRQMAEAFRSLAEAWLPSFNQFMTAMKPVAEWAEHHPEELAAWQAQCAIEPQPGSCHCLCATHRDQAQGGCTGIAEPGLTVHFDSPVVGPVDVPMCLPCYEARRLVTV